MFVAKLKGRVMECKVEREYVNKKGEKVKENVLTLYQLGNRDLMEVSCPVDYKMEVDEYFDDFVVIRPWARDGRSGILMSLMV